MKVYIKRRSGDAFAVGEYDENTGKLTVLEGSSVSMTVHQSEKFRGASTVLKMREEFVVDGKVSKDVEFKSPSTAANFVTGTSTNGFGNYLMIV